jgi:hypothetical protein
VVAAEPVHVKGIEQESLSEYMQDARHIDQGSQKSKTGKWWKTKATQQLTSSILLVKVCRIVSFPYLNGSTSGN